MRGELIQRCAGVVLGWSIAATLAVREIAPAGHNARRFYGITVFGFP
jgi:hypothetical protein